MDYISSRELAKRWKISPTRVITLAKEGRIPEAKLIGKCWVFPQNTEKPCDKRRKESRSGAAVPAFRFPIYFYTKYTSEEIERTFSKAEKMLYAGEQLFFAGEYEACCEKLNALLFQTDDPVVDFGALYCLCIASIYLRKYQQACLFYQEMQRLYWSEITHRTELIFLLHDLETYFKGNRFYIEGFKLESPEDYPTHMYPYLLLESAYSDMLRAMLHVDIPNPIPYELFLHAGASDLSPLTALLLHIYVAEIWMEKGDKDRGMTHVRASCRLAEENHMEHSIAYMLHYSENVFKQSLLSENPEQFLRLQALSEAFISALNGLFEYSNKQTILQNLEAKDLVLLHYAKKGMSNKEIASIMRLSMATISKRYAVLYEKTGTHSKSELIRLYGESIKEF